MFQEKELNYPSIAQSWGIVGITVLSMLVFGPVKYALDHLLGEGISFLIYYLLSMATAFAIAHSMRKSTTRISKYDFSLSTFKIMALVSISIIAIQTGIITPIANLLPMPEYFKQMFIELGNQTKISVFIGIVIAAPILEELIFRGIILDGLLRRYPPVKSIVISSFLFGILHLNPWQFISSFIGGLFSGWVYYRTRKLSLTIIIHAVNNLIAFVGMYFSDAETVMNESIIESYGGSTNMGLIIICAIIVSIISFFLLKKQLGNLEIEEWQGTTGDKENLTNSTVSKVVIKK